VAQDNSVSGRSGRGRWQRVLEARQQARADLGRDPIGGDPYGAPIKRKTAAPPPPKPALIDYGPGVLVQSLGEAAAKLGVNRAELEDMIAASKIRALPTGYTRMIPTREVERLIEIRNG
jgi:hypothetical protein